MPDETTGSMNFPKYFKFAAGLYIFNISCRDLFFDEQPDVGNFEQPWQAQTQTGENDKRMSEIVATQNF